MTLGNIRVLFITANSYLRSTTSSLDAIIKYLQPHGLQPVMVFRENGPWQQELAKQGIPCYTSRLLLPDWRRPVETVRHLRQLAGIIKQERIDLVHCNEHELFPVVRRAARWTGRPTVVTVHFMLTHGFSEWAFRPPFVPDALQFLSRAQLAECRPTLPAKAAERVVLLMSGLNVDELLQRAGTSAHLRESWPVRPETVVIGTASTLRPRKRLEDFVTMIDSLRRQDLDVVGVIAGGGRYADSEYEAKIRSLIRERQLDTHCLMIGNLDPIGPFYSAIDLSVNTSEMEILSMSLCEAQAFGVPTLAYDVGGNIEALGDPWCAVPFGDTTAMTTKMAELVRSAERRVALGEKARAFVREHFDAPALATRQASVYSNVLKRRAARE